MITQVLIAVNAIVFLAEGSSGTSLGTGGGGTVFNKGALFGPSISINHEYWRLLSSGFLHLGLLHLAFNMLFLYFMGPALEQAIGRINFTVVYFTALLGGSFGALLFEPLAPTVGASGAAFGVLGALIVIAHARRISIWETGLGLTLVINVAFSLTIKNISIGGHLGGFVAGALAGFAMVELSERRGQSNLAIAACVAIAAASVAGAIAVAGMSGITPTGI
jgi:membrane associated rhomboid family serine protease